MQRTCCLKSAILWFNGNNCKKRFYLHIMLLLLLFAFTSSSRLFAQTEEDLVDNQPSRVELTNVPPVIRQRGAICASASTSYILKSQQESTESHPILFSPYFVVACYNDVISVENVRAVNISDTLRYLEYGGCAVNDRFDEYKPFIDDEHAFGVKPELKPVFNGARKYQIDSWKSLDRRTENAVELIKSELRAGNVVILSMNLTREFQRLNGQGKFENFQGELRGRHAIACIGYDDDFQFESGDKGGLLLQNSWGTRFGENGRCWVSYRICRRLEASSFLTHAFVANDSDNDVPEPIEFEVEFGNENEENAYWQVRPTDEKQIESIEIDLPRSAKSNDRGFVVSVEGKRGLVKFNRSARNARNSSPVVPLFVKSKKTDGTISKQVILLNRKFADAHSESDFAYCGNPTTQEQLKKVGKFVDVGLSESGRETLKIKGKVDTGGDFIALGVTELHIDDHPVTLDHPGSRSTMIKNRNSIAKFNVRGLTKEFSAIVKGVVSIDQKPNRYVVEMYLNLDGDKPKQYDVTLTDRGNRSGEILLGKPFITKNNLVVDVSVADGIEEFGPEEYDIIGKEIGVKVDGIGQFFAKVDTGGTGNAIHVSEISFDDITFQGRDVEFELDNDGQPVNQQRVLKVGEELTFKLEKGGTDYSAKVVDYLKLKSKRDRYVVEFDVAVGGNTKAPMRVSLANRTELQYPFLLGRPYLASNNLLVDIQEEHVSPRFRIPCKMNNREISTHFAEKYSVDPIALMSVLKSSSQRTWFIKGEDNQIYVLLAGKTKTSLICGSPKTIDDTARISVDRRQANVEVAGLDNKFKYSKSLYDSPQVLEERIRKVLVQK